MGCILADLSGRCMLRFLHMFNRFLLSPQWAASWRSCWAASRSSRVRFHLLLLLRLHLQLRLRLRLPRVRSGAVNCACTALGAAGHLDPQLACLPRVGSAGVVPGQCGVCLDVLLVCCRPISLPGSRPPACHTFTLQGKDFAPALHDLHAVLLLL